MKRWIAQVFDQRTFLGRESFEQKLLERWREDETKKFVERDCYEIHAMVTYL